MALKGSMCTGPEDNASHDDSLREKTTSVCEVNHKCNATLGCTIANQEAEIKSLLKQEETLRHHVEKLEQWIDGIYKSLENSLETISHWSYLELRGQLKELTKHNNALESAMKQSKIAFECEQNTLQKVQETLTVAGVALIGNDYALKSEKVLKEECDNMASTIGNGMDEAAD
uniref:Uncharacterized protein n=1 Tax=Glossina pallidipes TaxID=7398 RepID=A0A1A9ZPR1_GLOPL